MDLTIPFAPYHGLCLHKPLLPNIVSVIDNTIVVNLRIYLLDTPVSVMPHCAPDKKKIDASCPWRMNRKHFTPLAEASDYKHQTPLGLKIKLFYALSLYSLLS